jgi:PAS domain-containing protein
MTQATEAVVETAAAPEVTETPRDVPATIDELAAQFTEKMESESATPDSDTAAAGKPAEDAPKPEKKAETPAFDPKAAGMPEAYWNCKSAEEVVALAEKRRADAESLAHAHDTELGELRKKAQEAPKPAETAPEAAPKPAEWTAEQRSEFQRQLDEQPEAALGWLAEQIQAPLVAKIAELGKKLAEIEGKAEAVVKETKADREAREVKEATQEFSEFAKANPDAVAMRDSGAMGKAFKAVNEGRQEVNDVYADIYGIAKLADSKVESDKAIYPEVLKQMRRGARFDEARDIAEALRLKEQNAKSETVRKVEEAKRRGRVAGVGQGAGSPGSRVVNETSVDALLQNHYTYKE